MISGVLRFVDQNIIHLVHDGKIKLPLDVILDGELHVVAQVVEPELVIGAVGNIGAVGLLPRYRT